MAKGFEAIGSMIDLNFTKCLLLLDDLESTTENLEINMWVMQISNLCRAHINFHKGDFIHALQYARAALDSPIKSGTIDPIDQGRLIRLVCSIKLIQSDIKGVNKCAQEILNIANPDNLIDLSHTKSAIKAMQLLVQGNYKQAYEIASAVVQLEEVAGRSGITAPFDCRAVMARCLYEFSQHDQAIEMLEIAKTRALESKSNTIYWLCEVGQIRVLAQDINNFGQVTARIEKLRDELLKNSTLDKLSWLIDLAEVFFRHTTNENHRVASLVNRNPTNPYIQMLGRSQAKELNARDIKSVRELPEVTPFEIIYKNLLLSQFSSEGVKKQRKHLEAALNKAEEVGAKEIFLRQDNLTLESVINISEKINSQWMESLARACLDRINSRNALLNFRGEQLTHREIEVLKYLSTSKSIEQIGRTLHISKNTMKTHLRNIYRKLNVSDRNQAAEVAKEKLLV
jgi:DNA-binding CsgD family transcriptional regulator